MTRPGRRRRITGSINLPFPLTWDGGAVRSLPIEIEPDLMPLHVEDQKELLAALKQEYPSIRWHYTEEVQRPRWEEVDDES